MTGIEYEEDKRYKSKAKCPKCGSIDLLVVEICEEVGTWIQENGIIEHKGWFDAGSIVRLECSCLKCKHSWKPRKINQVTELYVEEVK